MGLRSRLRVVVPFLAVVLTAATASALDGPSFGDLRVAYPHVDAAVDAMPNGSLRGSLNHISALLQSSPVGDLPEGSSELMPANVERGLVRAIEKYRERLSPGINGLEVHEQLALLQTTSILLFEPIQALYSDVAYEFCPEPSAGCDSPAVLSALDRLGQDLIIPTWTVLAAYEEEARSDASLPAVSIYPDEAYNAFDYPAVLADVAHLFGLVHGEPIID